MGRTRRGRLQTRQCHATPPPPSAFRSVAPSATGAPRARALQRRSPRVTSHQTGHAHGHGAFSPPLASHRLLVARSRSPRHARATATACLLHVSRQGVRIRCRVAEPSARPVAVARFSLDTVMIALPSGSSCSCLCGQLNNSGSRSFFARPESRPNPIAG